MTGPVTISNLADKIFAAAKVSFGAKFPLIRNFVKAESEKLAETLRMIIQASAKGEITETEARILLNQQKVAASAVLTSAAGMTAVAVQSAINEALKTVRDFVNGKIGFPLL